MEDGVKGCKFKGINYIQRETSWKHLALPDIRPVDLNLNFLCLYQIYEEFLLMWVIDFRRRRRPFVLMLWGGLIVCWLGNIVPFNIFLTFQVYVYKLLKTILLQTLFMKYLKSSLFCFPIPIMCNQ